jgi:uncharacterized protein (TIGR00251 family)
MATYTSTHSHGTLLRLKVVPNASRERIVGALGEALKVAVTAPAESGRANAAVLKLLAGKLGVAASALHLAKGQTQPRKEVVVAGMTPGEVVKRLGTGD